MRAAVVLTALAIKSFLWLRTMTPRDILILRIAAFGLLVLMLTIMGMRQNELKSGRVEVYCATDDEEELPQPCEFKLRSAASH